MKTPKTNFTDMDTDGTFHLHLHTEENYKI